MSSRTAARSLLVSATRGRGRELRSLGLWSLVEALPAFASGRLVAVALDRGFLADRPAIGFAWLGLLGLCVVCGAVGTRQTYIRLSALVEPFRDELARLAVAGAIQRSTAGPAPSDSAGLSRLTQQVEIAREAAAGVLMVVQVFVVTGCGAVLGLWTLSPRALLVVVPPVVLAVALFVGTLGRMEARQRDVILADEELAAAVDDMVAGLRDITACGGEHHVAAHVGQLVDAQAEATVRLARLGALRTLTIALGGWGPVLLLLVAGPWLVRDGASAGVVVGAVTYVLQGVHPALQTMVREVGVSGLWLRVTLDRIGELAREVEPDDVARPTSSPSSSGSARPGADVRLVGVTFAYGAGAEPVVCDLDLAVPEGDHLAVVGPSGAGKSTLAAIVAGLLTPQSGRVSIGGVRVDELDTTTRARLRVLVPQEAYVFAGTALANLTYLCPGASRQAVLDAADRLGGRELVERLGGLDAFVRPGALSAGEKQLLTAVRAYLSPAPVIVLDEATCHLDPAAEARVEECFAQRHGTLVVVAHRISSATRARRVLLVDGGRATVGSHEELLALAPLYRDMLGFWQPALP